MKIISMLNESVSMNLVKRSRLYKSLHDISRLFVPAIFFSLRTVFQSRINVYIIVLNVCKRSLWAILDADFFSQLQREIYVILMLFKKNPLIIHFLMLSHLKV